MENLSHTFAGLAIGEIVHRALPAAARPERRRRILLTASALAANFPDLDLVYTGIMPAPLGYLLHHRGHTHTLLWLLPQALLLVAVMALFRPGVRHALREDRSVRAGIAIVVSLGLVMHILFDALNSYGVHAWAPFSGDWFYGDAIFIAEPFFWVCFGVPFLMTLRRRAVRYSVAAVLVGLPLFCFFAKLLNGYSLAALAITGAALAWAQRRALGGVSGLAAGLACAAAFVGVNAAFSARAKEILRRAEPWRVLDVALTPLPTNPFCWSFLSISRDEDDAYRIRRGRLSVMPEVAAVEKCPWLESPDFGKKVGGVVWTNEETGSRAAFARLAGEDCRFNAWLRFARVPSVSSSRATDLRFARAGDENFSTLRLDRSVACPRGVPPWGYPRADLMAR